MGSSVATRFWLSRRAMASESGVWVSEPSVTQPRGREQGESRSGRGAGAAAGARGDRRREDRAERVAEARVAAERLEIGLTPASRSRCASASAAPNSSGEVGRRGPISAASSSTTSIASPGIVESCGHGTHPRHARPVSPPPPLRSCSQRERVRATIPRDVRWRSASASSSRTPRSSRSLCPRSSPTSAAPSSASPGS